MLQTDIIVSVCNILWNHDSLVVVEQLPKDVQFPATIK